MSLARELGALAKLLKLQGVKDFKLELRFQGQEEEEEEREPIGFQVDHVGGDQLGLSDAEIDLAYEEDD